MSVVAAAISVDEYLATSFDPDCDYVDGQVLERNVGKNKHSYAQTNAAAWFVNRKRETGMEPLVEQRLKVADRRFRVPDLMVLPSENINEEVISSVPFICIEITSPADTMNDLQDRMEDYLRMEVPNIWVIDPWKRNAWVVTKSAWTIQPDLILRSTSGLFELPVEEVFLP